MVRKIVCDNETFIAGVSKIIISISSVLLAAGMMWLISTVNATEYKLSKTCADVEAQEKRIISLERISSERNKMLSDMNRELGIQSSMLKFLAEKQGYKASE